MSVRQMKLLSVCAGVSVACAGAASLKHVPQAGAGPLTEVGFIPRLAGMRCEAVPAGEDGDERIRLRCGHYSGQPYDGIGLDSAGVLVRKDRSWEVDTASIKSQVDSLKSEFATVFGSPEQCTIYGELDNTAIAWENDTVWWQLTFNPRYGTDRVSLRLVGSLKESMERVGCIAPL